MYVAQEGLFGLVADSILDTCSVHALVLQLVSVGSIRGTWLGTCQNCKVLWPRHTVYADSSSCHVVQSH